MSRTPSAPSGSLGEWLELEGLAPAGPGAIADVALVRSLLIAAARDGRAVSYSELLGSLGHRFTRPRMRALCRTLDAIDAAGAGADEPGLAVLVVRESDGLPGQGWWTDAVARGYAGSWEGPAARAIIRAQQDVAFQYWRDRSEERGVGDQAPDRR